MSDIAIRIEDLSKQYCIGANQGEYTTLRDTITDVLMSPVRGAVKLWRGHATWAAERRDTIWALKDVSCEIKRGEIVGIIGHNGAGKSTLLKILSRITKPTMGFAEIHGRVGSLLEVGTGFHPELTGRENIYLNGSILGMKRAEIERKFDEIVAFAEVEKFIDTPVKYYSSGMYLRLAFSVAAHLEPDILLVDEVLAVGDARFWSKCINKIQALNSQGMTITLISHYLWLIQTLCSRAICLDHGRIVVDGDPLTVIGMYRELNEGLQDKKRIAPQGQEAATILNFQVFPEGKWATEREAFPDSGMTVVMVAQVNYPSKVKFRLHVTNTDGFAYFTVYSDLIDTSKGGRIECKATIPYLMLLPGDYSMWGTICSDEAAEQTLAEERLPFSVKGTAESTQGFGVFWNHADWHIQNAD
jgi:ABC-type polysaccharide/polyol phosphate transport system ATPase subunit